MASLPNPDSDRAAEVLREGFRQAERAAKAAQSTMPKPVDFGGFRVGIGERETSCPSHGDYTSTGFRLRSGAREFWSGCKACERDEADRAEVQACVEAVERQRIRRERLIGEADIPARFQNRTIASFVADTDAKRHAQTMARDYIEQFDANLRRGAGMVFVGLPGTGKSHLAAAILLALVDVHQVKYTTCMGLIRMVRDTWRRDSEVSERVVLNLLCEQVDVLVIDEVGVQYGTDGEQTVLFEVLDRRYSGMRPTILLTNQDKEGFKAFVGDRAFDRLRETSRWIPFDWPSYRSTARGAA